MSLYRGGPSGRGNQGVFHAGFQPDGETNMQRTPLLRALNERGGGLPQPLGGRLSGLPGRSPPGLMRWTTRSMVGREEGGERRGDDRGDYGRRGYRGGEFGGGGRDRDGGRYGDRSERPSGRWERNKGGPEPERPSLDRDRGFGDQDRGDFYGRGGGYGGDRDRDQYAGKPEPPHERPKLNLAPRTKPLPAPELAAPPSGGAATAAIFGGAKPVDTMARDREIEERLALSWRSERLPPRSEDRRSADDGPRRGEGGAGRYKKNKADSRSQAPRGGLKQRPANGSRGPARDRQLN